MSADAPKVFAVVPAAGVGRRMGGGIPKQYLPLLDKTVIEHSVQALLAVPAITQVVVAVSPNDAHWRALPVASDPRVRTVMGGAERARSVCNALDALQAADHDWVLVHDAVRPCIQPDMVEQLLQALGDDAVGGLLALPLADTLKQEQSERVTATLDRAGLWCAQTPQMFRYGLLKTALRDALQAGIVVTDESAAIERAGHAPRLIAGTASNLKVTRADDLLLAAYWLPTLKELH